MDGPQETYAVQLVQPDGITSTASVYVSPDGNLPSIGDVIPADEHGGRARVTEVWPGELPAIRAELFDN